MAVPKNGPVGAPETVLDGENLAQTPGGLFVPPDEAPASSPSVATGYVVPLIHTRISARLVDRVFWVGLIGAAALGAVELPLVALVGAGVVVARHTARAAGPVAAMA